MNQPARILVVDDELTVRELLRAVLEGEGHEVIEARSGEEALELLAAIRPNLVMMDVVMPGLDGVEVCRRIKADPRLEGVFVVLISGRAMDPEDMAGGLDAGADEYLLKPFFPAELSARVNAMLRIQRGEAALRESERLFHTLFEQAADGIIILNDAAAVVDANPSVCQWLDAPREEIIGRSLRSCVGDAAQAEVAARWPEFLKAGRMRGEVVVERRAGEPRWVEFSAKTGFLPGCHLVIARDVTVRKEAEAKVRQLNESLEQRVAQRTALLEQSQQELRAEIRKHVIAQEALRESEERFRLATRATNDVIWDWDMATNHLWWSSNLASCFGYATGFEHCDFGWWDARIHPEDRRRVLLSLQAAIEVGRSDWAGEYRFQRADGTYADVHDRGFIVRSSEGRPLRMLGAMMDITDRKRMEQALRESESRKGAILESALDAIITIDHAGRVLEFNPAAEAMFGYARAEVLGQEMARLIIPPALRKAHQRGLAAYLATGQGPVLNRRLEMTAMRRDGSRFPAELAIVRAGGGTPPVFTGFIRDITERKRFEQALKELPQRILEAQEAERRRVARELHDGVGQLLASARFRVRAAEEAIASLSPQTAAHLARARTVIGQAIEETRRTARWLLPSELADLGLATAVRAACQEFQERTSTEVECRVSRRADALPEEARLQLYRIVQEALNNVERHARARRVLVQLRRTRGAVLLRISDDGAGFAVPEPRNHHGSCPGGLGLANMRERAAALRGRLEVVSAPGAGTTISVRLPQTAFAAAGLDQPAGNQPMNPNPVKGEMC